MAACVGSMGVFGGQSTRPLTIEVDTQVLTTEADLKSFKEACLNRFQNELETRQLISLIKIINQFYDIDKGFKLPTSVGGPLFDIEVLKNHVFSEYMEGLNVFFFFILENLDKSPMTAQKQLKVLFEILNELRGEKGIQSLAVNTQISAYIDIIQRALEFSKEMESLKKEGGLEDGLFRRIIGSAKTDFDEHYNEFPKSRICFLKGVDRPEELSPFIFVSILAALANSKKLLRFAKVAHLLYEMEVLSSQLLNASLSTQNFQTIVLNLSQKLQAFYAQFSENTEETEQLLKLSVGGIEGFKKRANEIISKVMVGQHKAKLEDFLEVILNTVRNLPLAFPDRETESRGLQSRSIVRAKKELRLVSPSSSSSSRDTSSSSSRDINMRVLFESIRRFEVPCLESAPSSYQKILMDGETHSRSIRTARDIDYTLREQLKRHIQNSTQLSGFLDWLRFHPTLFTRALDDYKLAISQLTNIFREACYWQAGVISPIRVPIPEYTVPIIACETMINFYHSYFLRLTSIKAEAISFNLNILDRENILSTQPKWAISCLAAPENSERHIPLVVTHLHEQLRIPFLAQFLGLGTVQISYKARVIYHKRQDNKTSAKHGEFFKPWAYPVIQFDIQVGFVQGSTTMPLFTSTDIGECSNPFIMKKDPKVITGLQAFAIENAWSNRQPESGKITWHSQSQETLKALEEGILKVVSNLRNSAAMEIMDHEGNPSKEFREAFSRIQSAKDVLATFCRATDWEAAEKLLDVLWDETSLKSHFRAFRNTMDQPCFSEVAERGVSNLQREFSTSGSGAVATQPSAILSRRCFELVHVAFTREQQSKFVSQADRLQEASNTFFLTMRMFASLNSEFTQQLARKDSAIVVLESGIKTGKEREESQRRELAERARRIDELNAQLKTAEDALKKAQEETEQAKEALRKAESEKAAHQSSGVNVACGPDEDDDWESIDK